MKFQKSTIGPHLKNPSDALVCSYEPDCVLPFSLDSGLTLDLSSFTSLTLHHDE